MGDTQSVLSLIQNFYASIDEDYQLLGFLWHRNFPIYVPAAAVQPKPKG